MARLKMNSLIAIGILALYIICLGISFNTCYSLNATEFEQSSKIFVDNLQNNIYQIQNNTEYKAESMDELIERFSSYEIDHPYVYAIYDKDGNIVFKSGVYLYIEDLENPRVYYIDDYITDEIKEKIVKYNKKYYSSRISSIQRIEYFEDENTFIPVKITYKNLEKANDLVITLSDATPNKIYNLNSSDYNIYLTGFDHTSWYNPIDRAIQTKLNTRIMSKGMAHEAKKAIELYNGGGGYEGGDESEHHSEFELNGQKYYFYVATRHNLYYDTYNSISFIYNTINQTILFSIVAIFVFIIANKLYKKNKIINETRETFTSAAAHELKTPITIINNQCECLLNNTAPEKKEEYIETIYKQNRQMSHLVSNLLQYNRLSLSTVEKVEFDLKEVVEAELEKYEALIEYNGINLVTNIYSNKIKGDKDFITLVVDNFISNAIKHTENSGKIKIDLYYKKLTVFNEGKLISDEDKNKIWEVFNHSVDDKKSSGMGLAISKKILELHKFDYGFENKANGVEFYFYAK